MLVFGVDIPLVEIILVLGIIIFILLLEALVIIILLTNHLKKSKEMTSALQQLSEALLSVKRAEEEQPDKVKKK